MRAIVKDVFLLQQIRQFVAREDAKAMHSSVYVKVKHWLRAKIISILEKLMEKI